MNLINSKQTGELLGFIYPSVRGKYIGLLKRFHDEFPPVELTIGKAHFYDEDKIKAFVKNHNATEFCANILSTHYMDLKPNRGVSPDFEYADTPEFDAIDFAKNAKGKQKLIKDFIAGHYAPMTLKLKAKLKKLTAKHFPKQTTRLRVKGFN